jgi:hypothetical protein
VEGDGFPSVVPDGAVTEHLEVLGVMAGRRRAVVEGVGQRSAVQGELRHAPIDLRRLDANGPEHGRRDVDGVMEL